MKVPLSKVISFIISDIRCMFYGDNTPTKSKKYAYSILCISILLAFYGYNADVITSNIWNKICLYFSGVATIIFCAFWYFTDVPVAPNLQKAFRIIIMLAIFPSVICFVFYVATAHGVSSILTNFIGTPKSMIISATKQKYSGTKACRHQITGSLFDNAMPSYLCISKSEFELLPAETFEATLIGKQSFWGFSINSWKQNLHTTAPPNGSINSTWLTVR